ncbi:MAG: protein kinase [Polyangiaceae bacterium]
MSFDGPIRGAGPPDARDDPHDAVAPVEHGSLGKYHIFATLGRGGMADVYLAVARGPVGFNKLVVIKRLRPQLAEEAAFRDMFLDEARLAARLSHPNIVNTFEVGEEAGAHFIAMEYLEGQALNKVIRESIRMEVPIAPTIAARILADMLLGLSYAHNVTDYDGSPLGIIHRDVSPHNIFVTYDGCVKVVDFGIAKAASTTTETEVGVLKGKVAYMAPEHATGARIDARADVFAAGIVLWELLTRQRLFPGENAAVTIHRLMSQPIAPPRSHDPRIPRELEQIVMRALEKDPAARYQSAADMRAALEEYIVHSGAPVRQEDVGALLVRLFSAVREDVQSKIRSYMSRFQQPGGSRELRALTAESVERLNRTGSSGPTASSSASLLRLGSSAQRTPRVPTYPPPPFPSGSAATYATGASPDANRGRGLLVPVLIAGFFFLGIALLLVFGWTHRTDDGGPRVAKTSVSATSAPTTASSPEVQVSGTGAPTIASSGPTAPASVSTPRVASTAHAATTSSAPRIEPSTKPTEAVTTEPGFLTLDTYPWTKVTEGGRVLGTTPLVRVQLSAGPHTLTFDNPEQSIHQTTTVVVKSGETLTKRLAFK